MLLIEWSEMDPPIPTLGAVSISRSGLVILKDGIKVGWVSAVSLWTMQTTERKRVSPAVTPSALRYSTRISAERRSA